MSVSRKCPNCSRWNTDRDICEFCNNDLNVDERIREREVAEIKRKIELNTDRIDRWIEKLSHSQSLPVKVTYYVVRSVWYVFFIFLTFIYALIVLIAG